MMIGNTGSPKTAQTTRKRTPSHSTISTEMKPNPSTSSNSTSTTNSSPDTSPALHDDAYLHSKTHGAKHSNRITKRPSSSRAHCQSEKTLEVRYKRVWKACERCRMKKTKCDGENPCKRCKDDGVICTAGSRKSKEYKQVPNGYAELLENSQYVMQKAVLKLYAMVRDGQSWAFHEPSINKEGFPVIHDICASLGIGSHTSDSPDLFFPESREEQELLMQKLQIEELRRTKGEPNSMRKYGFPKRDPQSRNSVTSDTSFDTDPASLQPSYGGSTLSRLAPKSPGLSVSVQPLESQVDTSRQFASLPLSATTMENEDRFDNLFEPFSATSNFFGEFTDESQDDMMWMESPNTVPATLPQAHPTAYTTTSMGATIGVSLDLGLPPSTLTQEPLPTGFQPINGMKSVTLNNNISNNAFAHAASCVGDGTIRPGMLERNCCLHAVGNGMGSNGVGEVSGPWSFKNFRNDGWLR